MSEMTSTKPYFVKAIYQWILDNNKVPFVEVNAMAPHVAVPPKYVKEGRIILNIDPKAVNRFRMDNDAIEFEARFDDRVLPIFVPMYAVNAIFAADNGQGMTFPPEEAPPLKEMESLLQSTTATVSEKKLVTPEKPKPKLTLLKDE